MNIGQDIYDLFGNDGWSGLLLVIFLIFLLDALVIPTLPEFFFVVAYMAGRNYGNPALFGCELIAVAALAELIGILSLYYVVKHIRIPKRVENVVHTYTDFLIMGDERLLLLNRVAPMIPFAGAFIAISEWNARKCIFYIVLGCVLKFGIILLLSDFFYGFFGSDDAELFTLIMIFAIIGISMALSLLMRKKHRADGPGTPDRDRASVIIL